MAEGRARAGGEKIFSPQMLHERASGLVHDSRLAGRAGDGAPGGSKFCVAIAAKSGTMDSCKPEWRNGRRGGLKNRWGNSCEFESHLGHHFKRKSTQRWVLFSLANAGRQAPWSRPANKKYDIGKPIREYADNRLCLTTKPQVAERQTAVLLTKNDFRFPISYFLLAGSPG